MRTELRLFKFFARWVLSQRLARAGVLVFVLRISILKNLVNSRQKKIERKLVGWVCIVLLCTHEIGTKKLRK